MWVLVFGFVELAFVFLLGYKLSWFAWSFGSVSKSSSDSEAISAQVFLANFGILVRPMSSKA